MSLSQWCVGRDPRNIKVFAAITVITDATEAAAQAKYADLQKYASVDGGLALYGGWTGVDLSQVDSDAPLSYTDNDSLRTVGEMFTKADPTKVCAVCVRSLTCACSYVMVSFHVSVMIFTPMSSRVVRYGLHVWLHNSSVWVVLDQ